MSRYQHNPYCTTGLFSSEPKQGVQQEQKVQAPAQPHMLMNEFARLLAQRLVNFGNQPGTKSVSHTGSPDSSTAEFASQLSDSSDFSELQPSPMQSAFPGTATPCIPAGANENLSLSPCVASSALPPLKNSTATPKADSIYHRLKNVRFVPFPSQEELNAMVMQIVTPEPRGFQQQVQDGHVIKCILGQLPMFHEVTQAQIAWVFHHFLGCDVHIAQMNERCSQGRFKNHRVIFLNQQVFERARAMLNERILFDRNGVWFVQNSTEIQTVKRYLKRAPRHVPKSATTLQLLADQGNRRSQEVNSFHQSSCCQFLEHRY